MSISPAKLQDFGGNIERLTVDQYHRMIESGILMEGSPIELLDGILVRKDRAKAGEDLMTVGTEHAWAVQNLSDVFTDLSRYQCHLRTQQPITIVPSDEPEPDAAIVHGRNSDYFKLHPIPQQIRCIIEVADSSLQHDRTTKQRIYASAGIPHYVIVNLVDRLVESYVEPNARGEYVQQMRLSHGEVLNIVLTECAAPLTVPVTQLLPPQS